jgi:hypothetical protein
MVFDQSDDRLGEVLWQFCRTFLGPGAEAGANARGKLAQRLRGLVLMEGQGAYRQGSSTASSSGDHSAQTEGIGQPKDPPSGSQDHHGKDRPRRTDAAKNRFTKLKRPTTTSKAGSPSSPLIIRPSFPGLRPSAVGSTAFVAVSLSPEQLPGIPDATIPHYSLAADDTPPEEEDEEEDEMPPLKQQEREPYYDEEEFLEGDEIHYQPDEQDHPDDGGPVPPENIGCRLHPDPVDTCADCTRTISKRDRSAERQEAPTNNPMGQKPGVRPMDGG